MSVMNTFGDKLRLTTFGESHGPAVGGVLDGFPAGVKLDFEAINAQMARRRPGKDVNVSARRESDIPHFISGINHDGVTLGSPIAFIIENNDARSGDYEPLRHTYRPSHADYTTQIRYGIRDHRGGGRASARETAARVCAAAMVRQLPVMRNVSVQAVLQQVGATEDRAILYKLLRGLSVDVLTNTEGYAEKFEEVISAVAAEGDSIGGTVLCVINGVPAGVGNPVYDKLSARLAEAMMSINAARGFELGGGFEMALMRGSEANDCFRIAEDGNRVVTSSNNSGGIQGGISNGMPIFFRVAFRPTPSISIPQPTVTDENQEVTLELHGRHDPCVAVRAVPVVEAMAILTIADMLL